MRATLDTCRRIADDVVEILRQFGQHAFDAGLAQRLLVSRLAGGEDVQVLVGLVLDQCLPQVGLAIDDVDEVEHHAPLAAHDQVEIAQADVEVDDDGLVAAPPKARGKRRAGGRLADPPLASSHSATSRHPPPSTPPTSADPRPRQPPPTPPPPPPPPPPP